MKLMPCPLNGLRNISEFICAGELKDMPLTTVDKAVEDKAWADYLFNQDNAAGIVREWWCHSATSYWFIAERHTVTDEIIRTYPADEIYKQRVDFTPPPVPE